MRRAWLLQLLLLAFLVSPTLAGTCFTRNPLLKGYDLKATKRVETKVNRDLALKGKRQTPANLMDQMELIQSGIKAGTVKELFLESGLSVLLMEKRDFPTVTTQVWHKIGSHDEDPQVNGISHLLEHLLFKGTKSRPAQFMRLFYILGAEANAFTNYDVTVYYETAESDKLYHMLTLEADRLVNANLEEEQVLSERDVVISELMGFEGRPSYRLNRMLMGHVYGKGTGYGLPIGGLPSDVEKMTVEQVQAHYNKFYGPDHATLVVVGDFDTAQTMEWVTELFGAEDPNGSPEEVVPVGGNYSDAPASEYEGEGQQPSTEDSATEDSASTTEDSTPTTSDDQAPVAEANGGTAIGVPSQPEFQHMVLLYLLISGVLGPINPMFAVYMQQFLLFWFGSYLGYNVGVPAGSTLFGGSDTALPPAEPEPTSEPEPTTEPAPTTEEEPYEDSGPPVDPVANSSNTTDVSNTSDVSDTSDVSNTTDTTDTSNTTDTNGLADETTADTGSSEDEAHRVQSKATSEPIQGVDGSRAHTPSAGHLPEAILNNPWLNIPGGDGTGMPNMAGMLDWNTVAQQTAPVGPIGSGSQGGAATPVRGPSPEEVIARMRSILGGAAVAPPAQSAGSSKKGQEDAEMAELEKEISMLRQDIESAKGKADSAKMTSLIQNFNTLTSALKLMTIPPVKPTFDQLQGSAGAKTVTPKTPKHTIGTNVEVKGNVLSKLTPTVEEGMKEKVARRLERVLMGEQAAPSDNAFNFLRQQIESKMHHQNEPASPEFNTKAAMHDAALKMKQAFFPTSVKPTEAKDPMDRVRARLLHANPEQLKKFTKLMAKSTSTSPYAWHRHGNGLNAFLETETTEQVGRAFGHGGLHLLHKKHRQPGSGLHLSHPEQKQPNEVPEAAGHGFVDPKATSSFGKPQNGWYFPGWFGGGGFGGQSGGGGFGGQSGGGFGGATGQSQGSSKAKSKFRISDSEPVTLREEGMMDALIVQVVFPMSSMTFNNLDRPTFEALDLVLTSGHSSILSEALDGRQVQWSQVSSEFTANGDTGWYSITMVVGGHDDVPLVQEAIGDVIAKLREDLVDEEELEVAKTNLRVRALFASDEPADLAQTLGEDYLLARDYSFTSKYNSQTELITTESIREACRNYFVEGNAKVGIYENYMPEDPSPQFVKTWNKAMRRNAMKNQHQLDVRQLPLKMDPWDKDSAMRILQNMKKAPHTHSKPNQYKVIKEQLRQKNNRFAHGARWGFTTKMPQMDMQGGVRSIHGLSHSRVNEVDTLHNRRRFSELDFSDLLAIRASAREPSDQTKGYLDINRDLGFLPSLPPLSEHKPVKIDAGEKHVMSNGMEVLLLPEDSGLVRISGRVLAGAVYDSLDKAGLSAITATLLMQQTQHYSYADFVMNLEEDVSDLSFQPGRESVSISGFALPEHFERVLQIVQEALVYPDFQAQDVTDLGEALAQSIGPESQSAEEYARQRLQSVIFPDDHAFHTFPTMDSYRNIQHDDVKDFFANHYGPKTTRLVITGNFDTQAMKVTLDEMFSEWKSDAEVQIEQEPPVKEGSTQLVKERQQVEGSADLITVIGRDGIARCADNFYVAQVASQILGGDTLSARLGTYVRDQKGLTYGVYSSYESGMHAGMFLIHMQTAPDKTNEAVSEIYHVLDDWIKDGVNDLEVDVAKRNLISQQTMSLSDPSSIGSFLVTADLCGISDPKEAVLNAHTRLLAVTTEEVNAYIRKYMDPSTMHEVIAGAVEDIV